MVRTSSAALLVAAVAACQPAPPTGPASSPLDVGPPVVPYEAIDLGTLPGRTVAEANAFNNNGQIVGWSEGGGAPTHAFLWQDGVMTDLGTVGGGTSRATGINDLGQVVGQSTSPEGRWHPFLWSNGVMVDLHPGAPNFNESVWPRINNAGQVIWTGYAIGDRDSQTHPRAWLWSNGVLTDLLGGSGSVADINDLGQVAGNTFDGRAFLWDAGTVTYLPSLGGAARAMRINNRGQIVGSAQTSSPTITHAVLWQDGQITDLGVLPGDSLSSSSVITESGQVAGLSYNYIYNGAHPFGTQQGVLLPLSPTYLTDPTYVSLAGMTEQGMVAGIRRGGVEAVVVENGVTWILPTLQGAGTTRANAINEQGDVVGLVYDGYGFHRAILWRRTTPAVATLP